MTGDGVRCGDGGMGDNRMWPSGGSCDCDLSCNVEHES